MNAIANREITPGNPVNDTHLGLITILLAVVVLVSAFAVVYVTDLNRRLFIQYQEAQVIHNQLYVDWGKLLLEQSTWSTQARIQNIAQQRLNMEVPATSQMIILK